MVLYLAHLLIYIFPFYSFLTLEFNAVLVISKLGLINPHFQTHSQRSSALVFRRFVKICLRQSPNARSDDLELYDRAD